MGKPKVSVIIPVYGVEQYIERCARSLMEQTLDEMEFIFVDDATKDASMSVLERVLLDYPKRKGQVLFLHHEVNKGLPIARQTGLRIAKGEYIAHCDSDDWVDPTMYETMYKEAQGQQVQMMVCDWVEAEEGNRMKVYAGCYKADTDRFLENMLFNKHSWSVCNKLIERRVYEEGKILFPTLGMGEDLVLCTQLVDRVKKIGYIAKPFYYYRVNLESMSRKRTMASCKRQFEQVSENVAIVLKMFDKRELSAAVRGGLLYLRYHALTTLYPIVGIRQYYDKYKNFYPHLGWHLVMNPFIAWDLKVKYVATLLHLYPLPKYRVYR